MISSTRQNDLQSAAPRNGAARISHRRLMWPLVLVLLVLSTGIASGQSTTTWTGFFDNDWDQQNNWTLGVPTSLVNAAIPAGMPNAPILNNPSQVCRALNLMSGATLELPPGTLLEVHGDLTVSGALLNTGKLVIKGSSLVNATQPITNLDIDPTTPTSMIDFNGNLTISNELRLLGGTLRTINGGTKLVQGPADLAAGTLLASSGVFHFDDIVQFGDCDCSNMPSLIASGDWASDVDFNVTGTQTVTFDGSSNILATNSVFPNVTFSAGSTVNIQGGFMSVHRTINFNGSGFSGTVQTVGGVNATTNVTGAAGTLRVAKDPGVITDLNGNQTWGGDLEIVSGTLRPINGGTKTFLGNLSGIGGAMTSSSGLLDIRGNATMTGTDVSGMSSMNVGGNFSADSSFQAGSGTITFDGSSPQIISTTGATLFAGGIATGATADFQTPTVFLQNFTTTGTGHSQGAAVSIGGTINHSGTANPAQEWILDGPNNGTVTASGALPSITVNTTAMKDLSGNVTIGGDTQLLAGTLRSINGGTKTFQGTSTFSGGNLTSAGGTLAFNAPVLFNGTDASLMPPATVSHDWTSDASFDVSSTITITFNGVGRSVNCPNSLFPNVTFASGSDLTLASTMRVARNILCQGAALSGLIASVGSISATSTITGAADSLRVAKDPGFASNLSGNQTWSGYLEVTSGECRAVNGGTKTFQGNGNFSGGALIGLGGDVRCLGDVDFSGTDTTSMFNLGVGGDWTSDASFQPGTGTVSFIGTAPQTLSTTGSNFWSLTVAAGADVDMLTVVDIQKDFTNSGNTSGMRINAGRNLNASGSADPSQFWAMVGADSGTANITSSIPNLEVDATGTKSLSGNVAIAGQLRLLNGTLRTINGGTKTISGPADLLGGSLVDFGGTINFDGPTTFSGCDASGMPNSIFSSDFTGDASFDVTGLILLTFDGVGATINAAGSVFPSLTFASGSDITLATDVAVARTISCAGAALSGTLVSVGSLNASVNVSGAADSLRAAKDAGINCDLSGNVTLGGSLEVVSGNCRNINGGTKIITGPAVFSGGTLQSFGGSYRFLALATFNGSDVSDMPPSEFRGGISADASLDVTSSVTLTFNGSQTLTPLAPGSLLGLANVSVTGGTVQALPGFRFNAASVTINAGQTLDLDGAEARLASGSMNVNGVLRLGPNGGVALGSTANLNVNNGSGLTLAGLAFAPARITGDSGGGYSCLINGLITASNFVFEQMNASGIRIGNGASFAAAPHDFRGGIFDQGSSTAGSVLLDIQKAGSFEFSNLTFLNSTGTATFNARTTSGANVNFRNWSGSFGGDAFEDDVGDTIEWPDPVVTELDFFTLEPGSGKVRVRFGTNDEVDVASFRVERSESMAGPFAVAMSFAASGPGTYEFLDTALLPNTIYFYRLVEVLDFGGENELATGSVTTFDTALPANVLTVGAGGTFADIQTAIAAAILPNSVIRVASGTYPAFDIGAGSNGTLRIESDGSGPVIIDTSMGPVRIQNKPSSHDVELLDLEIGAVGNTGPALEILNTNATILLHDCRLLGGTTETCRIDDALRVAFQRTDVSGGTLVLDNTGALMASRGDFGFLDLRSNSELVICDSTIGGNTVDGTSTLSQLAGPMPILDVPSAAFSGDVVTASIDDRPQMAWFMFLTFDLEWFRPISPFIEMTGLGGALGAGQLVGQGFTDPTGLASMDFNYPLDPLFQGLVPSIQYLAYDSMSGLYRFSEVGRILLLP